MSRTLSLVACAVVIIGLVGCSDNEEPQLVTVHDTIDRLSRDHGFEFDPSHRGGPLCAARIVVEYPVEVTEFAWSGVLDTLYAGQDGFLDGTAEFEISIYAAEPSEIVADVPIFQTIVPAIAEELPGDLTDVVFLAPFKPHQFTHEGAPIVNLATGEYWIVVANTKARSYFNWAVQRDHVGVAVGSGGAVRESAGDYWQSPVVGTEAEVARGYSLRVVGHRLGDD